MSRNDDTQWIVDGSGELVPFHDPFKNITPEDAAVAERTENAIIETKQGIERNFLKLAYLLDLFDANELYKGCGFEDMRSWAMSQKIELSWKVVQDLLRIRREMIPVLTEQTGSEEQAQQVLITAGVSKARAALPLLRDEDGEEKVSELIERAPELTWNDVRAEVKRLRGIEEPIDKRFPAIFKARARQGDEFTRLDISVMDGGTVERCGTLNIRNRYMPRWDDRFGEFIEYAED